MKDILLEMFGLVQRRRPWICFMNAGLFFVLALFSINPFIKAFMYICAGANLGMTFKHEPKDEVPTQEEN